MTGTTGSDESTTRTLFDRWQEEQRNWQRLVLEYADKAGTDEAFLTNLGNAMRGSLLANRPYPGTSVPHEATGGPAERSQLDEVLFALRRVEGQLLDLTMVVESLARGLAPASDPSEAADADGPTPSE